MIQQNTIYRIPSKNNRFVSVCSIHKSIGWLSIELSVCWNDCWQSYWRFVLDVRVFHILWIIWINMETAFLTRIQTKGKKNHNNNNIIDIKVDKIGVRLVVTHISRVNDVTGWWIVVIILFTLFYIKHRTGTSTILVEHWGRGSTQVVCM